MDIKPDARGILVAIVLVVGFLYYNVVFSNPIVFGDEGYYAHLSKWISENWMLPTYEPWFGTNIYHQKFLTPPSLPLTESLFWAAFAETGVKLLIPISSLLAAFFVYLIGSELKNKKAGVAAAFVFLMTPSLITYGVMNYRDTIYVLFFSVSVYFGILASKNNQTRNYILAGIFAGMTLLSKTTGYAAVALVLAALFLSNRLNERKKIALFLLAVVIVFSPWLVRNLILFGSPCFTPFGGLSCANTPDIEIQKVAGLDFSSRAGQAGTEMEFLKFGILNYSRFSYGWAISLFLLLGIASVLLEKRWLLLLWFAVSIPILSQSMGRAEDTARHLLPVVPAIALISGNFVSEAYSWLSRKHVIVGLIFILAVFLFPVWVYGQEKITTMDTVKKFSPTFIEACEWIRDNTPEDSVVFSTYGYQTSYQCKRKSQGVIPDLPEILLGDVETSYTHLKQHGIKYVFLPYFFVSLQKQSEGYTVDFLNGLETTTAKFKTVYDSTSKYGNAGVKIFEVL